LAENTQILPFYIIRNPGAADQFRMSSKLKSSTCPSSQNPLKLGVVAMLDIVLTAISYSSAIALAAAGITLIYMTTGTFSFAHASLTAWGFYIVFSFSKLFFREIGNPYIFFPISAIVSGSLSVMIYLAVNRWLLRRRADMITLMMSTLGIDLIYFAFLNVFADYLTQEYKINARLVVLTTDDITIAQVGGFTVRAISLISMALMILTLLSLHYLLNRTRFGIAIRVTIESPSLAEIIGINPERVYLASWFIGGALAGLAGAILSMVVTGTPAIGNLLIVPEFAGSVVGGLYSLFGSFAGGYLIGLSEYIIITLLATFVSRNLIVYQPLIPLLVMTVFLLVYPNGIGAFNWRKILRR